MRRALLLAVCIVGLAPHTGRADHFSFSLGGGHGHHHHHRHCHGPSWSFGFWAPPPRYVYVAPPPVVHYVQPPVVQQPVVIQQAAPLSSTVTPPANVASNRLPAPPTRAASTGSPVVIRNATGKGVAVAFLVDEQSQELRDGQTRSFAGASHVIEFDRGGDLGTARYELTSGLYSFVVGDNGWELMRETNTPRTADRPAIKRNELPIEVSR
jgi:hypothetical protein